jgi:hypothetical protein
MIEEEEAKHLPTRDQMLDEKARKWRQFNNKRYS